MFFLSLSRPLFLCTDTTLYQFLCSFVLSQILFLLLLVLVIGAYVGLGSKLHKQLMKQRYFVWHNLAFNNWFLFSNETKIVVGLACRSLGKVIVHCISPHLQASICIDTCIHDVGVPPKHKLEWKHMPGYSEGAVEPCSHNLKSSPVDLLPPYRPQSWWPTCTRNCAPL